MRAYLALVIAFLGFVGMAWAMLKKHLEPPNPVIVVGFGVFALIFAMGVAFYSNASVSGFEFGPGAVKVALTSDQRKDIAEQVSPDVIRKLDRDVRRLVDDAEKKRIQLEAQERQSANTLRVLVEVERKLAPRRLTPSQRQTLVAALQGKTGSFSVEASDGAQYEAMLYCDEIAEAFKAARWVNVGMGKGEKDRGCHSVGGLSLFEGVAVLVNDPNAPPPASAEVLKALQFAKIAGSKYLAMSGFPKDDPKVTIIVGSKPLGQ